MHPFRIASLTALTLATAVPAQVFHVSPGGPFTQISAALQVAPPNSTVVVATGTYQPFTLTVGLTIVAALNATPVVLGESAVVGVPAGQTAALGGLSFTSRPWTQTENDNYALRIGPCAGTVLARGISCTSGAVSWRGSGVPQPLAALGILDATAVLDDAACRGTSGTQGLLAMSSTASAVVVNGGTFAGGDADCGPFCFPDSSLAGHAILAASGAAGSLWLHRVTAQGGSVVNSTHTSQAGDGLVLTGGRTFLRGGMFQGGTGGIHAGNRGGDGLFANPGTQIWHDGAVPQLFLPGSAGSTGGLPGSAVADSGTLTPRQFAGLRFTTQLMDLGQPTGLVVSGPPLAPHLLFLMARPAAPLDLSSVGILEPVFLLAAGAYAQLATLIADGAGNAPLSLTVPNDPALIGRAFLFESFAFDPIQQLVVGIPGSSVLR